MPLGVFNPLCAHDDEHISVGIHCLFLCVGSCRNLCLENKQIRFHAFSIITQRGVWSQLPI